MICSKQCCRLCTLTGQVSPRRLGNSPKCTKPLNFCLELICYIRCVGNVCIFACSTFMMLSPQGTSLAHSRLLTLVNVRTTYLRTRNHTACIVLSDILRTTFSLCLYFLGGQLSTFTYNVLHSLSSFCIQFAQGWIRCFANKVLEGVRP